MGLLQPLHKSTSSELTVYSGVLLQTTATTAAQFTIGRFISFGMTGMTIVVVPIYLSETAPKALRGMMTSTLQLMIIFGQVVASLVNFGTQNIPSDAGWRIPVGLQFIAPGLILALLPAVPESPRWLVTAYPIYISLNMLKSSFQAALARSGRRSKEVTLQDPKACIRGRCRSRDRSYSTCHACPCHRR